MYGTIARIKVKAGQDEAFRQLGESYSGEGAPPGMRFQQLYRSDGDPREFWLLAVFESKDAYVANAHSPEQHTRYTELRELLDADPEWHDVEQVFAWPSA